MMRSENRTLPLRFVKPALFQTEGVPKAGVSSSLTLLVGLALLVPSVSHADFTKVTTGPPVTDGGQSYGAAWGDYDNDGDLDLFVANDGANNFLYANSGNANHWINLQLVGTQSNVSAIGAKVRLKAAIFGAPVWQLRELSGQTGTWSQNSLNAEFGLGDATSIDSIRIEWPSGIVWDTTNVAVDQFLTILELGQVTSTISGVAVPEDYRLFQNMPNPFNPATTLRYGLPERTHVVLRIYDILGRPVRTLVMGVQQPGFKTVVWTGTNDIGEAMSTGVYLYQMQAGDPSASSGQVFTETRKMILLK